jgi:hypothetical protein
MIIRISIITIYLRVKILLKNMDLLVVVGPEGYYEYVVEPKD